MAWLSLTGDQFRNDLIALGLHVVSGTGPVSTWKFFDAQYNPVAFNDLITLLEQLAPGVYYKDTQGYHYVQQPGAVNPTTGKPAEVTSPTAPTGYVGQPVTDEVPDYTAPSGGDDGSTYTPPLDGYDGSVSDTTSGLGQVGITYADVVDSALQADPTIDGDTLRQQLQWQEDAAYDAAVYGPILAEAFGADYASQDWYMLASGAQGSGLMRAKIAEAQNRIAFREAYRNYNLGADPDTADYDWITSNYVSPNEYATRMAAKESAKRQFTKINDLLQRTLNHSITLAELENMAVGGAGSGEVEAMIDEATRLDAFTDTLYQYLGHAPTADDYAREVKGFSSVDAFKWEITVREKMNEMRDDINDTLQRAGYARFSDQQLRIMLGQSEGWGELKAQYNKALEEEERMETSRRYAATAEKISPVYTGAFQGGFKTGLPELPDLGGM